MIGIKNQKIAFGFDVAVAIRGSVIEKENMEKEKQEKDQKQESDDISYSKSKFKLQLNSAKHLQNRVRNSIKGKN